MSSPLESPEGHWWNWPMAGRERTWLGVVGVTAVILFGWMVGWMAVGDQNPTGPTFRVSERSFQQKVNAFKDSARSTDRGFRPAGRDVYVGARQWGWDGLPVVLEAGREYRFHLSSYDVQHGFSVRPEDELWKQINLQVVPGYEWVVPMSFEEPGTYRVLCNEFCGLGHRVMQAAFHVVPAGGEG